MMNRLNPGEMAPLFTLRDAFDREVRIEDYRGKLLMLSFYRYASCPLCNLRVHELLSRYPQWKQQGLEMFAVFESPKEHIHRYLDRHSAPFPILSDPQRDIYRLYGVQGSWPGFFRAWIRHLSLVFRAVVKQGFLPGRMDGDWAMIPADFLISPDLRIVDAFYGEHIGDHIPVERVQRFLDEMQHQQTVQTN